jgi:hypothetical protein
MRQFFLGPQLKGARINKYSKIYIDITVNRLPECRIWPFMRPQILNISRGERPGPLIIVLEDGITRSPKSNVTLGTQISLGAVQCMFVLAFLNINCSLFCGYTLLQRCVQKFSACASAQLNFAQKCAVIKYS